MNNMNVSNEHLLLINILNTMYNDNNRQIQSLTNQNNQIINIITEILRVPSPSSSSSNRQPNNNRQQSTNRQPSANRQPSTNRNRQHIIDDIQRLELPIYPSVIGTSVIGRPIGTYRENPQTERLNTTFSNLFQSFFDPVLIFPTPSQIETATRRVLYRDIVTPINNRCPCLLYTSPSPRD